MTKEPSALMSLSFASQQQMCFSHQPIIRTCIATLSSECPNNQLVRLQATTVCYHDLRTYIGLFHLIRVPPMDDLSVSVPGGIDMLGYLRILL